jgi:hypothetical protein
MNRYRERVSNA